jgi:hypothetical protein
MSEQPTPSPDPDGPPEAPPSPETTPAAPRSGRRRALLGGLALIAIAGAAIVLVARPRGPTSELPARRDGGAAIRAPRPPGMPGLPGDGLALTGVVVDGAGEPIDGAELTLELEADLADHALSGGMAVAATTDAGVGGDAGVIAGAAGDAGVPPLATAAPTGADGRFALDGLDPGRYRLRVTGRGLLDAELRAVPVPSDELRIVVARQVAIEGTVTDDGKPVVGASVGVRGEAIGGTLEVKTDVRGTFAIASLPEGRYQVFAYRGPLAARAVRVVRLGAGPFEPVELRLEAGANVAGRVIDRAEGTGLVAAIELRPVGDDQVPRYARSGEDGSFLIEGVPNGRWIVDAFAPGYLSPGGVELDAGRGIPELALARGAAIEGRVLDGAGQPVAGATLRALGTGTSPTEYSAAIDQDHLRRFSGRTTAPVPAATGFGGDPQLIPRGELGVMVGPIPPIPPPGAQIARSAAIVDPTIASAGLAGEPPPLPGDPARDSVWVTGPDGRYRIRGLPQGKVHVIAAAPGFAEGRSRQVAISTGELIGGVDVVLTAGAYLTGKVSDPRGVPIAGARIAARPEVGAALEAFAGADGTYRMGPLSGQIELVASAFGFIEARRRIAMPQGRGSVPDVHREDVVLEAADATLAGTLDDATGATVAGATIEVLGMGRRAVVSGDGTFELDMLPSGPMRVRVTHPDYPTDEFDVVASRTGERSRLRLALGGAVEGVLLDATRGEPLAGTTITARGLPRGMAETATDKDGRWTLGPLRVGRWRIEVRLPGFRPFSRELDVPVSRAPGVSSVRDVRIDLARGALLGGTVRDRRGQRIAGARVTARAADGSGDMVEGNADGRGEFRLHDCPAGEVVVTASFGDATASERITVRPGAEILGLALELR